MVKIGQKLVQVVCERPLGVLIMLTLKNIEYKASIISILIMLALKNINYKASNIGVLIMLALKNIK